MNYLYNGVELSALPNWDNDTYPYALIYKTSLRKYRLICSASRIVEGIDGTGSATGYFQVPNGDWLRASYSDDIWGDFTEYSGQELLTLYTLIWTNTDLLNYDGSVYLAASDPIPVGTAPVLDPLSLFMGWKAGNWVARQRGKKKTPVAYLYNGVRLPNISAVWTDKTAYPYAVIFHFDGAILGYPDAKIYQLALCIDEWQYDGSAFTTSGKVTGYIFTDTQVVADAFGVEVGVWGVAETIDNGVSTTGAPVWTSHDILNSDGTIYLAASEPVPVYE